MFLLTKTSHRKAKILFTCFAFANLLFVFGFVNWYAKRNLLEAYKIKLQKREQLLKEIEDYNKQNVKNERRRLPKVIGIGVKKCGTDGIINFLSHHPLIRIPFQYESFFFNYGFSRGLDFYRNTMPRTNIKQISMEKTPIYFNFPPNDIPNLIKSSIPDVKLILIICDPTLRAFSDYVHERIRFTLFNDPMMSDYRTFENFVDEYLPKLQNLTNGWNETRDRDMLRQKCIDLVEDDLPATLLANGIYTAHIRNWKKMFNESTLKIVDGSRFMKDPGLVIEELQDYIGIPKVLLQEDFVRHPNTGFFCFRYFTIQHLKSEIIKDDIRNMKCLGSRKGRTRNGKLVADEKTLNRLKTFYQAFNQDFFIEIGKTFQWG